MLFYISGKPDFWCHCNYYMLYCLLMSGAIERVSQVHLSPLEHGLNEPIKIEKSDPDLAEA